MRINYYGRIFNAYLVNKRRSNLSFWHTEIKVSAKEDIGTLNNYYLDYIPKTRYAGPFDENGVPVLNYLGKIGTQYNPDAIAQYALGYFEEYIRKPDDKLKDEFLRQAAWFVNNLSERENGVGVWEYNFDWEYFRKLKKPWYTSLGQGHGISVLARAYWLTKKSIFLNTADKAFLSFLNTIDVEGGVKYVDRDGFVWFEEAIVEPCTHILNGFIWALWGLYDYWLLTRRDTALVLFNEGIRTLEHNLYRYDNGFWSTYDLAKTRLPGIASWYYHNLHIAQLKVLHSLTNKEIFIRYADKWDGYRKIKFNRWLAFCWKSAFKLFYW